MRSLCLGLAVALAAGGSGCGPGESLPASPQHPISRTDLHMQDAPSGEIQYRRYCIGCHGHDGRGNGGTTGADLTAVDGPFKTKSVDELVASVRDGKTGKVASMPAHKPVLSDAQIRGVLAYVQQRFAAESKP
jgi:mono/diheme cytochrome c family protein